MNSSHYSQIPSKPLVAGMSNKPYIINQIFFFERNDGTVIAVEESEAWSLYIRRPQILGKHARIEYKLIGVGSGEIFRQAVEEARIVGQTDIVKAQDIIRKGQADELEACRGKLIAPRDMDVISKM